MCMRYCPFGRLLRAVFLENFVNPIVEDGNRFEVDELLSSVIRGAMQERRQS
jgi:hypothetical protein